MKLKAPAKLAIVAIVLGALFGIYKFAESRGYLDSLAPQAKTGEDLPKGTFSKTEKKTPDDRPLKVGVVTWGGYAGGQYFNAGFEPNDASRYQKDFGLKVQFLVMDDYQISREAFKAGDVDVLWTTADSFPTEVGAMKQYDPKVIFQSDWSRGGDAIVARRGIDQVSDLKGLKVAFAKGTPSHTFLLWMLDAGDLSYKDIEVVEVNSAIDAAAAFKAGKVDAAVVWSPDDEDCVKTVKGAKVLKSTKQATHIIADVFYVKKAFLDSHRKELENLVRGWLIGAAEINSSESAKDRAAKILADGLKQPEDFARNAINNARLATYGDNANFFNLKGAYTGVKGEDLYSTMAQAYSKIRAYTGEAPAWRLVSDSSLISGLTADLGSKPGQEAEGETTFKVATKEEETAPAVATKRVSVNFPTGAWQLEENAKYVIQMKFGDLARSFAGSRIRIEGNTDDTGSKDKNLTLSKKRAQAVADFLVNEYHFDRNRFVVVGNGSEKPVASNVTADGKAKNRRTDFEILN